MTSDEERDAIQAEFRSDFVYRKPVDHDPRWDLVFRLALDERGLTCHRLTIEPAEGHDGSPDGITGTLVHSIALTRELDAIARQLRADQRKGAASHWGRFARKYTPPKKSRRGRIGYGDDHYEWVALAYLLALREAPRSPNVLLARSWHVDRATVRDWVNEARRREFLTEATHGRAGGRPGPKLGTPWLAYLKEAETLDDELGKGPRISKGGEQR